MRYISNNEHTKKIKFVTVLHVGETVSQKLRQEIDFIDREYPEISIEFVPIEEKLTPHLIRELSQLWNIPVNFMCSGSASDHFPYRIAERDGVWLII